MPQGTPKAPGSLERRVDLQESPPLHVIPAPGAQFLFHCRYVALSAASPGNPEQAGVPDDS